MTAKKTSEGCCGCGKSKKSDNSTKKSTSKK